MENAKVVIYITHVNCGLFVAHPLGRPVPPREFDLLGHLGPHERLDGGEFHGQGNQRAGVGIFLYLWQKNGQESGQGVAVDARRAKKHANK